MMKRDIYIYTSSSRASRGRKFQRKKDYIAKKEFAHRMCARRPTSAMPKPFLCCERAFCCSMVVMWPVLMHVMSFDVVVMSFDAMWLLVLCHVTWCNACDVMWCALQWSRCVFEGVLWQCGDPKYYSVLQSTTPVLLCTTQYYNVLLRYYKAAFMIDPWHIWTVIYMIDVRRIWNVIYNARSNRSHPPTSPNTAPATQNDCDDWSASHMKRHLQCAEQQESQSYFTKYCACHAKWISWLIRVLHETWFTMRGATGITIQLHQILRLPRKMNLMIDPHQIWNVIYNARSNRRHRTSSPNTAPATQNESHDWSASHMKRHFQCAEQAKSPSNLTKYCACHEICKFQISAETPWIASADARIIRG